MTMNRKDREYFLVNAIAAGLPYGVACDVRRLAATHDRLAEAECNGDWPCDNGERKVSPCDRCGAGYVRSAMVMRVENGFAGGVAKLLCKSCRTEDLIRAKVRDYPNVSVEFQGDPRGWTVKLSKVVTS